MSVLRVNPKVAVAAVFVAAMFMNIIDATVVNVALPTIAREFGVRVESTATVNIGYLVAMAVAIPTAGWLGDRFGARPVFVTAVGAFTAASIACGFAGSAEALVAFRILQGLGAGLMTPVGMTMLYRTFPPAERVRLSRIITIPIAVAPAIGPVLGGVLTEQASWRWIFWINAPVGLLVIGFTLLAVPPLAHEARSRLDVIGFVLASAGFASLMYAVSEGAAQGWTSTVIWAPGSIGLVLLGLLVVVERRVRAPLLQLGLFGQRLFRSMNLITFMSVAGFLGGLFAYPLMLQTAFGYSAVHAGLLTFPEAIGIMLGTQIASRLYPGVGPRRIIAVGQLLVAAALVGIALLMRLDPPAVVPVALMLVLGIGQGHTFTSTQAAAFDQVEPRQTGAATTLFNATRQLGSAIGVAAAATVITSIGVGATPATAYPAFQWSLLACAAFSMSASTISMLTVHDADAAPSRGMAHTDAAPSRGATGTDAAPSRGATGTDAAPSRGAGNTDAAAHSRAPRR